MEQDFDPELLNKSFAVLGFDENFVKKCNQMEFDCLRDVLKIDKATLTKRNGFSYLWLEQLSNFLKEKGMLHLLQPKPGSKNG